MKTGGPAFPFQHTRPLVSDAVQADGMSLRDYATIAMMAAWRQSESGMNLCERMSSRDLATFAKDDADAMLEARKKGN